MYFSYDPESRIQVHKTSVEAKAAARACLNYYKENALNDVWDEYVDGVCWGVIIEKTKLVSSRSPDPGNQHESKFDRIEERDLILV